MESGKNWIKSNLDIYISPKDEDVETFLLAAKSSYIFWGNNTNLEADPKNLLKRLTFELTEREKKLSFVDELIRKDKSSPNLFTYFLKNKYLYNYGDGTISYLKAMYSMEKELRESKETDLVIDLINKIKENHDKSLCYVSIGCGSGDKDLKICSDTKSFSTYLPVDVNGNFIRMAYYSFLQSRTSGINRFMGYLGDFTLLYNSCLSSPRKEKRVFFCLGNTIGNYREHEILDSIYKVMNKDDYFIISFEKEDEKQDSFTNRYKTIENTDFLLNPFKSIDYYNYARPRYLKRTWISGLSDIDGTNSYLITLGVPTSNFNPIHIIWSSRYKKDNVENFFNKSESKFQIIEIKEESNIIVVLLRIKEDKDALLQIAIEKVNKIQRFEKGGKPVLMALNILNKKECPLSFINDCNSLNVNSPSSLKQLQIILANYEKEKTK